MSEDRGKTVCFDYSHNNTLTIESPSYADFTQFLFGSSFRMGKIQAGFTSIDKLNKYKLLVIGGPRESKFEMEEINVIVEFVKEGGSLFVISDEGGDYGTNTNLSELTEHFGFKYNPVIISDSMNFFNQQSRVAVSDFEPHPCTKDVDSLVQSNACSIDINKTLEADEKVHIIPLARTSLNAYQSRWDGEQWIEEEDAPRSVMAVAVNFYKGRVVGLCTVSMFSSLSSAYGLFAQNNQNLITGTFSWLLQPPGEGGTANEKLITIPLNYNIFIWMEKMVGQKKWANVGDIINFGVKYLKDNYDEVMESIEKRKAKLKHERAKQLEEIQKITNENERKRQTALLDAESSILKKAGGGIDTSKELSDIMKSLSNITGGEVGRNVDIEQLKHDKQQEEDAAEAAIPPPLFDAEKEIKKAKESRSTFVKPEPEEIIVAETVPETAYGAKPEPTPETPLVGKPIDQEFKEELQDNLKAKLASDNAQPPQVTKILPLAEKPKPQVDQDLDAALKALGSFADFTKKLEEFKSLTDDDGPMTEVKGAKKSGNKISENELFHN